MQQLLGCNVAVTSKGKTQLETEVKNDTGYEGRIKYLIAWAGRDQAHVFISHLEPQAHSCCEKLVLYWCMQWQLQSSCFLQQSALLVWFGTQWSETPCPAAETTSISLCFGLIIENLVLWFHQSTTKITLENHPDPHRVCQQLTLLTDNPAPSQHCVHGCMCHFSSKTCTFYKDEVNWLWLKMFFCVSNQIIDLTDLSLLLF